ncbi:hypothetical protein LTS14_010402 [Recurvomyces mirabilis]|uniref:uncharacterized protein n=1 Tax=Recurvomyces mirabilis TaxID=574656 RepID=UPI002DDF3C67|nr:hypothetical protein LTS14_010402 [Recurvomyces mirabilis]
MASALRKQSLLAQALGRGLVELVGINEVKFLLFDRPAEGRRVSLGVKGLSACSVVILASDHGAIMAHIGPNELGSRDPRSYLRLANEKMDELESIFRENQRYFGAGSHAYLIFATFQDKPVSPEQGDIFRARIQSLDVPLISDRPYERSTSALIDDDRPEGTVWIVKRQDTRPTVYLEDRLVSPSVKPTAGQSQTDRSITKRLITKQCITNQRITNQYISKYAAKWGIKMDASTGASRLYASQ